MKMKVRILENIENDQIEVVIHCKQKNQEVLDIEKALLVFNPSIIVKKNDRNYTLTPNQIFYFDSVDNRVFCYTKDEIYEISLKLYQVEDLLKTEGFIRISKSTVVNSIKIKSFKSRINGKMELMLISNEKLEISRNYVPKIKELLGGKRS
jgi:DNA-binding LytR/AlgR family response regulator